MKGRVVKLRDTKNKEQRRRVCGVREVLFDKVHIVLGVL